MKRTALVCGAGGFIGHHLVKDLKSQGVWVRGVDLKHNLFAPTAADDFVMGDLRDIDVCNALFDRPFTEVYQLAADMGGAGYVFVGDNDADIMHNSAQINLNMLTCGVKHHVGTVFYSSSACMYPLHHQDDPDDVITAESSAYPAAPDSEYGWEKLFSERLYMAFHRCHDLNVKIGRFHNVFGPEGAWNDGKEKAPAALCRKIAMAHDGGTIDVWGDGKQTRSFLYITECLEAVKRLMASDWMGPVNIGSSEQVSINTLVDMIATIAKKRITVNHIPGPEGVRGRTSDNRLIQEKLGWAPSEPLENGLKETYAWIDAQVQV